MSKQDDPFSSKSNRTVIIPNPGGLKPPGAPGGRSAGAPSSAPPPERRPLFRPLDFSDKGAPQPDAQPPSPAAPSMPADEAWMQPQVRAATPEPARASAPVPPAERIPLQAVIRAINPDISAANPMLAAAGPLLSLLGRLPLMIFDLQLDPLMNHVGHAIESFDQRVAASGYSQEQAKIGKYALCALADDIVQNMPADGRQAWMQFSMEARYFGTRNSGVGFFEHLKRLRVNPSSNYDLLELMHACLSLGFQGQYRRSGRGQAELEAVRSDVYQALRHLKARDDGDISPRWRGLTLKAGQSETRIPLWVAASLAGVVLVSTFFLFRFLLDDDSRALAADLKQLVPDGQVTIQRDAITPAVEEVTPIAPPTPPIPTQLERIRAGLAKEIDAGEMTVDLDRGQIVINVNNVLLFAGGKSDVRPEFLPLAERIGAALDKEPGEILIIGHTDNVPVRPTARYKSNLDLSRMRAESVKQVLEAKISDPSRIKIEGRGDLEPVADNSTPEGRAQNRRVEVRIPREESLR
ncbi:Inner membrane lipoprotein YiaD precursor [Hartmannibacter diazotrophicus]|uniref:Inner membrane lipoprotein YiaD n=1 Tax=Hartmannibacter diazotrophicus TaxID=1482074 RepID=A0A2C9D6F4_9HYPH|nr:type VI secretion system protein TssL, long form [Hartmannibacter diazotrophicus]SON55887.1 Inner membrane lipoprotein YiaD precursor [Hartmannibacter diazotrophicus]